MQYHWIAFLVSFSELKGWVWNN